MKIDFEKKARDLVSQMTLEEKASMLRYDSPAIPRLGIPEYNWWNEAAHGVARAGTATVFPQNIGLAATFDEELIGDIAHAIGIEARAKFNMQTAHGCLLYTSGAATTFTTHVVFTTFPFSSCVLTPLCVVTVTIACPRLTPTISPVSAFTFMQSGFAESSDIPYV